MDRSKVAVGAGFPVMPDIDVPMDTLGAQLIAFSGYLHGAVGCEPTQAVFCDVAIGEEEYQFIDCGFDFERSKVVFKLTSSKETKMWIVSVEGCGENIQFNQPTTEEALDLVTKLMAQGLWSIR